MLLQAVVALAAFSVVSAASSAFVTIQAEVASTWIGTRVTKDSLVIKTPYMGYISTGDYVTYSKINFSSGAMAFTMAYASGIQPKDNCKVLVRLDSTRTMPFVNYSVETTGSWDRWHTATYFIPNHLRPTGVHDLYFTFEPSSYKKDVINIDWFTFKAIDDVCPKPFIPDPPPCPTQPVLECPTEPVVTCPDVTYTTTTDTLEMNDEGFYPSVDSVINSRYSFASNLRRNDAIVTLGTCLLLVVTKILVF